MEDAQTADAHALERGVREVDGVFNIAVDEVIIHLVRGHDGGALLALGCAGAEMRHADDVLHADEPLVREVGDVFAHLAGGERVEHGVVVHDLGAGFVDHAHALLHLAEGGGVEHVLGALGEGDVDADIIRLDEDLIHVHGVLDAAAEPPRGVHREIGVKADDVHAELDGDVCNERADRAEADDAEGLASELRAGEGGFALFDEGGDLIALVLEALDPVDAAEHVARGHDHGADDELLDGLGVRAGAVEHDNALVAAGVKRDVVRAGAAAGDDEQALAEGIVMQIGAAQEDALRIGHILADGAAALDKRRDAAFGDVVHDLDAEVFIFHGVPPQILSDRR